MRRWIRTKLFAIGHQALVMGQGHSPFLFFSNGEEIVGRLRGKNPEIDREWGYVPLLDRLASYS